jgi:DNA modification methylase
LWEVKKVNPQTMQHLTEKPVELAVRALQYCSRPGEHVLDLFGGSGSTLIAAEQTGRQAFLMELDPLYCDVIATRWEQFSGQRARRETGSGRTAGPASKEAGSVSGQETHR